MRTIEGTVTATRHAGVSRMGNPAYDVALITPDGFGDIRTTSANTSLAYEIRNACFTKRPHTFHLNARGKITHATHNSECNQGH